MDKRHHYTTQIRWTGNLGDGTLSYTGYSRNHEISSGQKALILTSADPAFRGDDSRYNPEELFLASLSSCHMLWYLHLCSDNNIVVQSYHDNATGTMVTDDKGGKFTEVLLRPVVLISDATRITDANRLHETAHRQCFIANSCNFPVRHDATCMVL